MNILLLFASCAFSQTGQFPLHVLLWCYTLTTYRTVYRISVDFYFCFAFKISHCQEFNEPER